MAAMAVAALAATLAVAAAAVARLSGRSPALCPAPRPGPAEQRPPATSGRRRRWVALGLGAVLGVCRSLGPLLRGRVGFGGRWFRRRGGPCAPHRRGASRGGGREGGGGGRGGFRGGGGGGWGPGEASCAGVPRPPAPEPWAGGGGDAGGFRGSSACGSPGGSGGDGGSWQGRPAAFPSGAHVAAAEDARLLECVVRDLEVWESSGQWIFSAYSPWKGKPNVTGFIDLSPEEMRLGYYNCRANNDIQSYMTAVQQLAEHWKNRVRQVKAFYASKKMALLSQLKNVVAQLCVPLDLEDSKPQALDSVVIM